MRNAIQKHSHEGGVRLTLLVLLMLASLPAPVLAQQSCNPDLDFTILNQPPFFLNDEMRVTANMGAKDIAGGNFQDISAFGFALNCHLGEDFHSCTDAGNKVEFLGNPTTDCMNANGDPAQLIVPQSNIIPIRSAGAPIRTAANEQCNVQFDMKVTELSGEDNLIVQAMGWPIANEPPTVCDNGLISEATSTIAFEVNACEIHVVKEVWDPALEQWVDANTDQSAPRLGPEDLASYRLRIANNSTVDFIGDLHVIDETLGVDAKVAPNFDGDGNMILGGGDGSVFDIAEYCSALLEGGEGIFTNTASVEGTCRSTDHSMGKVSAIDSDIALIDCRPYDPDLSGIEVRKYTNGDDANVQPGPYIPVGDPVTWTYEVYNTGNQGMTIDSLVDDMEGSVTCEDTFLEVDEFTTCTAIVGVASEGQYANVATVRATSDFTQTASTDTDPSHYFGMVASIDLVKTPDPLIYSFVDQVINYTFDVTNDGNVPLTNVHVTDLLPGLSAISCPKTELAVDETMGCSATYSITQADLDAKTVENTATAHGTDPNGGEVTDIDTATIGTEPLFTLGLVKTAVPLTYTAAGDVIAYGYELTNTGNQSVYPPYSVADDRATVSCPGEPATLLPGDSVFCSASYTILPADVDAGSVTNIAVGTAKDAPQGGNNVNSNEDRETVYYLAIAIEKQIWDGEIFVDADSQDSAPIEHWPAGAEYRIIVSNTGQVDLENVVVSDANLGLVDYGIGTLAVGDQVTIGAGDAAELLVAEACGESGTVRNTATAAGTAVTSGAPVDDSDDAFLVCVGLPDVEVTKEISIDGGVSWVDGTAGPVEFPSGALYRITVENTGQVDLVDVTIDDTLIPNGPYVVGDLAVGDVAIVTDGEWSELDMAQVCNSSGMYQNVADVTATSAEFEGDETTATDDATLDCIGPPMISILKEVSLDDGASWHDANQPPYPTAVVDDTVDTALYRLTVSNIGTVALFDVLVNDTQLGIVDYLVGSLNPGESVELGQGEISELAWVDICASMGEKTNVAIATGESAAGESNQASDTATVECIGSAGIRIVKEVSANGVTWFDAEVTAIAPSDAYYRITVSNIGNVALENVTVSDDILFGPGNTIVPIGSGGPGTLAIGETVVITHEGSGDNVEPGLFVEGLCEVPGTFPNLATAYGESTRSTETVDAEDDATMICELAVNICEDWGRPSVLKMEYNGTSDSNHNQGTFPIIVPDVVDLPAVATLKLYDKNTLKATVVKAVGEPFNIYGSWTPSGKIPPTIHIEILEGTTLRQSITFHGSCSAPLIIGDKFGGVTIIGYTP